MSVSSAGYYSCDACWLGQRLEPTAILRATIGFRINTIFGVAHQSTRMPTNLITLPHFSTSRAMKPPNSFGRCLRDKLHADIATAAGPIFNDERVSPLLTELLSDNSTDRIDPTTRLKRSQYPNRSVG